MKFFNNGWDAALEDEFENPDVSNEDVEVDSSVVCSNALDTGDGKFKRVDKGGVVGYKRIHKITPTEIKRVKIKFTSFRGELELQEATLY